MKVDVFGKWKGKEVMFGDVFGGMGMEKFDGVWGDFGEE